MARIRTIKPEFPQSESMARVSRDARLCFILMWGQADDAGRLRGQPRLLASLLFPYDEDATKQIGKWLAELEREGCIRRYVVGGNAYVDIPKWEDHQKIEKKSRSHIPPFPEDEPNPPQPVGEPSTPDMDHGSGTKEGKGEDPAPSAPVSVSDDFEKFWAEYPLHVARGQALKAFRTALTKVSLADLMAGLGRYKATADPKFLAHAATWLNGERWLDKLPGGEMHGNSKNGAVVPGNNTDQVWKLRLDGFAKNKFWAAGWGPSPDEPGPHEFPRLDKGGHELPYTV